jgi:hypothetical protein
MFKYFASKYINNFIFVGIFQIWNNKFDFLIVFSKNIKQ